MENPGTKMADQLKETAMKGLDFFKESMKQRDTFVTMIIWYIIFVILALMVYYYYVYVKELGTSECKYMDNLYSVLNPNIRSINFSDPNFDVAQFTFKDYYIKSAYNCCSSGNYKNGVVGDCALKDVIKQGVRGLDFEVYSIDDNPVIATSTDDSYYIKETFNSIKFADALRIIIDYGFSGATAPNSTDPIIIHIRFKSANQTMFDNLAILFKNNSNYLLGKEYSFETQNHNFGDTALNVMQQKIVIIVDRSNTDFLTNPKLMEYVNMTSNSIFMRALHYNDIKYSPDFNELQEYNKRAMTISMPDKGSNPPNPSGIVIREAGCQMIAMRYQQVDEFLEENALFFDRNGYAFALKPERLRYKVITIPDPPAQDPALSYAPRTRTTDFYSMQF